jgi:hypothetical protein
MLLFIALYWGATGRTDNPAVNIWKKKNVPNHQPVLVNGCFLWGEYNEAVMYIYIGTIALIHYDIWGI